MAQFSFKGGRRVVYTGSTVFRTDIYNDIESGDDFCSGRLKRVNDFGQEPIIRSEQLPY